MKKVIHFSKLFIFCTILSLVLILSGIVGIFTKGINLGIDFKPGLVQEVRIAPTVMELSYIGSATVSVETSAQGIDIIISGIGAANETRTFNYIDYNTTNALADAISSIEGITCKSLIDTKALSLFGNSAVSSKLSSEPYGLYKVDTSKISTTIDEVRDSLKNLKDVSVKQVGEITESSYQIRIGDDGTDSEMSKNIQIQISNALGSAFGKENVAIVKTDFVGSQFSKTIAFKSILLIIATLALIWVYATFRFHWDFALGAVLAILHDALIMVTFITWTQIEFSATTIAAILTIIGYSINDTVVVLDRVRENIKTMKVKKFSEILDASQSELISRTLITTITTLLAVFSLFFFTTGSMKDFAAALIVGMISGVYSTIFIAGAFIALVRRNWTPSKEELAVKPAEYSIEE